MRAAFFALALSWATVAGAEVTTDYAQFVRQWADLAQPLDANDFRHPAEVEMIDTLTSANPGIRDLMEDVKRDQLKQVRDKDLLHQLHSVEVTDKQHPAVHALAREAARALALHTNYRVFITNNPEMIDNIFGIPRHGHYGNSFGPFSILLTSGLVKALSPEELKFIIGREMGHVKANHRFYTALAFEYQRVAGKLPRIFPEDKTVKAPGLGGLITFFFERCPAPSRISEFSADRAGLVAVRKKDVAISALAKIARGDLEGMPGFNLEAYLQQVAQAAADLSPSDLADLVGGDGYLPYVLNRVSEGSRFGQSEEFKALVDRATVNPFLMEVETLFSIRSSFAHWTQRLHDFETAPSTLTMDPLQREVILKDLKSKVDRRLAASCELEKLVLQHIEDVGLAAPNARFRDLIATAARRRDGRPFKLVWNAMLDRINFALGQPDVPAEIVGQLTEKRNAIESVKDLKPKPSPRPNALPPLWVEASDLPAMVDSAARDLARIAANGTRDEFFVRLETIKPEIRAAALKLVLSLPAERRAALANLIGGQGGRVARLVAEIQAAGSSVSSLEATFDREFDRARDVLRLVPMFVIRRNLSRYAGLEF